MVEGPKFSRRDALKLGAFSLFNAACSQGPPFYDGTSDARDAVASDLSEVFSSEVSADSQDVPDPVDVEEVPKDVQPDISETTDVPDMALTEDAGQDTEEILPPEDADTLKIHILNVGQASAALIICPLDNDRRLHILLDMGSSSVVDDLDVLMPGLTLDIVIATHFDNDHIRGVDDVLDAGYTRPDTIFIEPSSEQGKATKSVFENWAKSANTGQRVSACDVEETLYGAEDNVLNLGGGAQMRVIAADGKACSDGEVINLNYEDNRRSIVIELEHGDFKFWSGGDLPAEEEQVLADKNLLSKSSLLQLTHHGSGGSNTKALFDGVQPGAVVASLGDVKKCKGINTGNNFGFPAQSALDNSAEYADLIVQTQQGGADLDSDCNMEEDEEQRDYSGFVKPPIFAYKTITFKADGGASYELCVDNCQTLSVE